MLRTITLIAAVLALAGNVACSPHDEKTAERSVSPLIGTWTRDGGTPKPDPKNPEFTKLTFTSDGKLAVTYVAAGGALAGVIAKAPKIEHEGDTYTTSGKATLRVSEGTSQRDYQYRVADGKLYLTPAGDGGDAQIYSKGSDS